LTLEGGECDGRTLDDRVLEGVDGFEIDGCQIDDEEKKK
jgi:hypothetical protein